MAVATVMAWILVTARKIITTSGLEMWREILLPPLAAIAPQRPNWQIHCVMMTWHMTLPSEEEQEELLHKRVAAAARAMAVMMMISLILFWNLLMKTTDIDEKARQKHGKF